MPRLRSKKLFIQIPCLNEEKTIGSVIQNIPKKSLESLGLLVKVLVVDDNSSDKTSIIAKKAGADMVITLSSRLGLARVFESGINYSLSRGADFIAIIDADCQYDSSELVKLVKPVLNNDSDMVIGNRQIEKLDFMPAGNKIGNHIGSWVIRKLTGLNIPDASSGFRVFNRQTALCFNLQSNHTYTHETIIQAFENRLRITNIPITFKKRSEGESRLITGLYDHIKKSGLTIIRTVMLYRAFKYLLVSGTLIILIGFLGIVRFLIFFFSGIGTGHVQSLVLSSVLIILGFVTIVLGVMADLISVNRRTLDIIRRKLIF